MNQLDMIKALLSWLGIFLMLEPMVLNLTHLKVKKSKPLRIQSRLGLNEQKIYNELGLFLNID
jgi:hypothetical protein